MYNSENLQFSEFFQFFFFNFFFSIFFNFFQFTSGEKGSIPYQGTMVHMYMYIQFLNIYI